MTKCQNLIFGFWICFDICNLIFEIKLFFDNMNKGNKFFYVICDNLRSRFNVGSIFRTADAVGITKLYLGGITPCPPHPEIEKVSLGASETVPWEHRWQVWRLVDELRKRGVRIIALELAKKSIPYTKFKPKFPLALIVGNEVSGVSKGLLKRADRIIHIPMYGQKESLNVSVAFGVAGYALARSLSKNL